VDFLDRVVDRNSASQQWNIRWAESFVLVGKSRIPQSQ